MQNRKSRMWKTMTLSVSSAIALSLLVPNLAHADNTDSLQSQQDQKQQQLNDAKNKEQQATQQQQQDQQQIDLNAEAINKLGVQIDEKENQIAQLQSQIFQKNQDIDKSQSDLAAAEQQMQQQDALLKERLRFMYENGDVQYLDVLLNSTSFSDFLDRFDDLTLIFRQDKVILQEDKTERDAVAAKKKQLEDQKASLDQMQSAQLDQKAQLDQMKSQKEAINQQLATNRDQEQQIAKQEQKIQDDAIAEIYQLQQQLDAAQNKQNTQPTTDPNNPYQAHGPFGWPLPGHYAISSDYGVRIDPFTGQRAGHNGIDIPAPQGTPIAAAQAGTVITSGEVNGFGNCVIIDHGGGLWTLYGHIENGGLLVSVGQKVNKGDIIAKVGTTGRSTGPHLHFGVYVNGVTVDPHQYL